VKFDRKAGQDGIVLPEQANSFVCQGEMEVFYVDFFLVPIEAESFQFDQAIEAEEWRIEMQTKRAVDAAPHRG
jgi:hypothetical protein